VNPPTIGRAVAVDQYTQSVGKASVRVTGKKSSQVFFARHHFAVYSGSFCGAWSRYPGHDQSFYLMEKRGQTSLHSHAPMLPQLYIVWVRRSFTGCHGAAQDIEFFCNFFLSPKRVDSLRTSCRQPLITVPC
jgi:hypothetical protein